MQLLFAMELLVTRTTPQKEVWQESLYLTMVHLPGNGVERGWCRCHGCLITGRQSPKRKAGEPRDNVCLLQDFPASLLKKCGRCSMIAMHKEKVYFGPTYQGHSQVTILRKCLLSQWAPIRRGCLIAHVLGVPRVI